MMSTIFKRESKIIRQIHFGFSVVVGKVGTVLTKGFSGNVIVLLHQESEHFAFYLDDFCPRRCPCSRIMGFSERAGNFPEKVAFRVLDYSVRLGRLLPQCSTPHRSFRHEKKRCLLDSSPQKVIGLQEGIQGAKTVAASCARQSCSPPAWEEGTAHPPKARQKTAARTDIGRRTEKT